MWESPKRGLRNGQAKRPSVTRGGVGRALVAFGGHELRRARADEKIASVVPRGPMIVNRRATVTASVEAGGDAEV